VQEQEREQRPALRAAELETLAAPPRLDRPEDPEVDVRLCGNRGSTLPGSAFSGRSAALQRRAVRSGR
jgi:hypothetical protein